MDIDASFIGSETHRLHSGSYLALERLRDAFRNALVASFGDPVKGAELPSKLLPEVAGKDRQLNRVAALAEW